MSKAQRHYWLDIALGLLSVLLAISSFLLWVVLPRGYHQTRTLWIFIHKWGGLAIGVIALAHVLLHWQWLVCMTRRQLRRAVVLLKRK